MKEILDACCGSKMFWFNRSNPRALFMDNRRETHVLKDKSSKGGSRKLEINPDVVADFTDMPFESESFSLVVFDPPHLRGNGSSGWLAKKYGTLGSNWRVDLKDGFAECFRVLKPSGVLVFKWNDHSIPVADILELAPAPPLFGNRSGRLSKSHWIVFMKDSVDVENKP